MNIKYSQYRQYKKMAAFLEQFHPHPGPDATHQSGQPHNTGFSPQPNTEEDKAACEDLIYHIIITIDALIKAENHAKGRNIMLPEEGDFFSPDPLVMMGNIKLYMQKFDPTFLDFNRTERQTFIFLIENLIDYFKRDRFYVEKADQNNLFEDCRFWMDNFFKIVDRKLIGSIAAAPLDTPGAADGGPVYANGTESFGLCPFAIDRNGQRLVLARPAADHLVYLAPDTDGGWNRHEVAVTDHHLDLQLLRFLTANLQFRQARLIGPRLNHQNSEQSSEQHIEQHNHHNSRLPQVAEKIEDAWMHHKERRFKESYGILREVSLEDLGLPLIYLVQIKNLVNINRLLEVKKLIQKFLTAYPFYTEGYEIMGDIYQREGNHDLASTYYDRYLKMVQSKRVADKLKQVREMMEQHKPFNNKPKGDHFYDITDSVFQGDERILPREKELRQIVEILLSDSRRNVMLVGDSGVGKTTLVRRLAMEVLNGDVPDALKNKRIKEINFVSLLTGSKYRGQFEEKVLKLFEDFSAQPAILVLEDVHLMIATGGPRGTSMDLMNILKQFLRDKSIQVIATTTYEEYKNTIEKDSTLVGFFQKLTVNEMGVMETRRILRDLAAEVSEREGITAPDAVVDQIIECAGRDIKEKKRPASAVMIFERTVAKARYKLHMGEINKQRLDTDDVGEVLSDMLNLPESNVPLSLKQRLLALTNSLKEEIVGQDRAVDRIASAITTAKLEFDIKRNRPDGVFLFIGPTGVGKTECAIALTRALYGSEAHMVRIDMSEYMEKFTYSRFVGAAPGYVGYTDANQLTDKVRQNPFCVILLDEVEKADSQLLNIFLQVFDAGRLTDARGNVVDFSHATIIMTSNIGTSLFTGSRMGYQDNADNGRVSHTALLKALKKYFSPEFLNRLDEVLIFDQLQEDDVKKIIDIQLKITRENLMKQEKELTVGDDVLDFIIREGYSREYGARHISRALRKHILEKIARLSLEKGWESARHILCCMDENDDQVVVTLDLEGIEADDGGENLIEGINLK